MKESKGDQKEKKEVCSVTKSNETKQWILDTKTMKCSWTQEQPYDRGFANAWELTQKEEKEIDNLKTELIAKEAREKQIKMNL
ncbi:hypothetical protein WN48_03754 [Eufriesea mexicana]|uniref:Uncharacterized protein n=1 Tax=Eufriesea mexicana TaxID=516756 RepID=A0A310S6L5_9HYME|nr:hypothetical protein WN48_03754 [Eufriesea mexicana]